ncbi:MAG: valine--tRNA ligase [ANME-2 cluster archaeon]|nr:valine--tRNA ligase [ANME-2 cluster archaeon]
MSITQLPKEYNPQEVEPRWMGNWQDSMNYFDWDSKKPQYIIDTPPPYPTGNFHIGNALNWCYIDFVARYKRMRGYNVMFPQGWDCHGLPTEVKVEEIYKITKNQVPRAEFRQLCEDMTVGNIEKMRNTMRRLAFSIDWSNEYITMKPEYYGKTQHSFVQMYNKDLIYRSDHPNNWCPRCETAIAFAEVEYEARQTTLNYFHFDKLDVATTRPELLAACVAVAVNPDDGRYNEYVGQEIEVPVFGHKVKVLSDSDVDPNFGTGVVMICTFGDKQDVRWWAELGLPLRKAIDKQGIMTSIAGKYEGMSLADCKEAITTDMKDAGLIYEQETLDQNVGLCWRCKTPIEILSERQWFVKIDADDIISKSSEINWAPPYMEVRLKNWTGTMEWDWCISRQRIFATPIPVWYCDECGEVMVAKEEWLPLDPNISQPLEACKCGSTSFLPEEDVLDTWMDSSITALNAAGWLSRDDVRMPTQLRPQGHDIIRTWAFYSILRSSALTGLRPWDDIMINGMVLGDDGHKMSKSLGNIVMPEAVVKEYGSDAFRQWAAIGGATGSDIMFRWKDVVAGNRFQQKLWSIVRFCMPHLENFQPGEVQYRTIDRWLLSKLNTLIKEATASMDAYQFDETLKNIRGFAWDTLADNYIELVKSRLYGDDTEAKRAAQQTLYLTVDALAKMLAPFIPYFADEVFSQLHDHSVHTEAWPGVDESAIDAAAEGSGEQVKEITAAIRRFKSDNGMALNAPLGRIRIYGRIKDVADIAGTVNAEIDVMAGEPEFEYSVSGVKPNMSVIGPKFRDKAGAIIGALKSADAATIAEQAAAGAISIEAGGETITLEPDSVAFEREILSEGHAVDVMEVGDVMVVVEKA